jgi:low affinity Fe/Cu permease
MHSGMAGGGRRRNRPAGSELQASDWEIRFHHDTHSPTLTVRGNSDGAGNSRRHSAVEVLESMSHSASGRRRWIDRCAARLERLAVGAAAGAGSSWGFGLAVASVLAWAVTGPILHFSDTWQLTTNTGTTNTGTTIVTFLMVFLIQRAQNKDSAAIHLKLNEIVAGLEGASNRLINVEDLSEAQVRELAARYRLLAQSDAADRPTASHSIVAQHRGDDHTASARAGTERVAPARRAPRMVSIGAASA